MRAPSPLLIELGRGISASLDGALGVTCAIAVTAGVIRAIVPAKSAISTDTRALLFICISSLSRKAQIASTFLPDLHAAESKRRKQKCPAYTKHSEGKKLPAKRYGGAN